MSIKRANASSVTKSGSAISDVPDAPTGLTATDSGDGTTASVSFTPAVTGGGSITSYTVTSSPGGFTGTGASSPISVTGLSSGVAYTFTATATNSSGTSAASSASGSLTLASVGNYFLIQRVTVGAGGQTTITFSSIPQTYTHLQLRMLARCTQQTSGNATNMYMNFNSDSGTNYTYHNLWTNGGGSASAGGNTARTAAIHTFPTKSGETAGLFGVSVCDILDYTDTTKYKNVRHLDGYDANGSGEIWYYSNLWVNTAAITTITLTEDLGDFAQYSTFALYGIRGA